MARRSHRPRGRRRIINWIYIIPVLLIVAVAIAFHYGPFGKDKSTDETADITPEANVPEVNETEQEMVMGPEPKRESPPEPATEPKLPEVALEPKLPEIIPVPDVEANPEVAELIAQATALLSEKPGRIIDAREKLNEALRMPMNVQQRTFVKDQLSELSKKWLLSKTIIPDDKLCGSYLVKSGDLLSTIGKRYKVPWEILKGINKISRPEALQAGEQIKVINGPFHAKVYRSTFTMDLYLQDETFVRSFRVGLGKEETETPTGLWRVKSGGKLIKPPWPDPVTGRMYHPEDPDYPLGSRWMGLEGIKGNAKGRTGFGIHGTMETEQIGTTGSRGCIRMHNGEVILIYNLLVPNLSTVEVVE